MGPGEADGPAASTVGNEPAGSDTSAALKISVVVPVYNPGSHIEACIESIVGQSLAPDEFEAIFVDDGSTDASPVRLDRLAETNPNVRVIHQPNSGWPGKPRNVGIEAARGRYVYFVDHDDVLGREALQRLYEFAERNGSDIVIGKMAGHNRRAPRMLFTRTRDRVTLEDSGIVSALSPHKLFRKAFLDAHGLRFPEGRRRLEDQVFVMRAYFAAEVISILADYTCYYHLALEDRGNAASGRFDPAGRFDPGYYFPFLREVLDVLEANSAPGPFRDGLLRRFVVHELLGRVTGRRFIAMAPGRRRELVAEIRSVVARYVPDTIGSVLSPRHRTQLALVRDGRVDLLLALAESDEQIRVAARVRRLRPLDGGRLAIDAEAELRSGRHPLRYEVGPERLLLPVPAEVARAVAAEARAEPLPVSGRAQIVLRRVRDSAEVILAGSVGQRLTPRAGGVGVVITISAVIDPRSPVEDHALGSGAWDVLVRVSFVGYTSDAPLRQPAGLGRSRPVALLDGRLAATRASWPPAGPALNATIAGRAGRIAAALGRRLPRQLRRHLSRPGHPGAGGR